MASHSYILFINIFLCIPKNRCKMAVFLPRSQILIRFWPEIPKWLHFRTVTNFWWKLKVAGDDIITDSKGFFLCLFCDGNMGLWCISFKGFLLRDLFFGGWGVVGSGFQIVSLSFFQESFLYYWNTFFCLVNIHACCNQ